MNLIASIRILIAEGPRQVLNALTLYSIFQLNLLPTGENRPKQGHNGIQQFWSNLEVLADKDTRQAIILGAMLYTLVIWVISAILLAAAAILYILFLWHYIPSSDGTVAKYCRRKIDGRVEGIVSKKTRKALEKAARKERKEERQALKRGETFAKPTLPGVDIDDDASSIMSGTTAFTKPGLGRAATFDSANPSSSSLARQPTLPDMDDHSSMSDMGHTTRPIPSRNVTGSSYASDAPLLDNRGGMGYNEVPTPSSAATDRDYFNGSPSNFRPGPPPRSFTGSTMRSSPLSSGPPSSRGTPGPYGPGGPMSRPPTRPQTSQSRGAPTPGPFGPGGLRRAETSETMHSDFSRRPVPGGSVTSPMSNYNGPPQDRRNSPPQQLGPSYEMSTVRPSSPGGSLAGGPDMFQRPPTRQGQMSPAPGQQRPLPNRAPTAPPQSNPASGGGSGGGYVAFNPAMHSSNAPPSSGTPVPPEGPPQLPPIRNFSSPVQRFASPANMGSEQHQQQPPHAPQRSFTSPGPGDMHGAF